jgi:hypothetical protein
MGNRSDRRLANLANPLAFEAVVPIRTRRADSIMARSKSQSSSQEAVYTNATGFTLVDRAACDRGWVHIRGFEFTSLRQRVFRFPGFSHQAA